MVDMRSESIFKKGKPCEIFGRMVGSVKRFKGSKQLAALTSSLILFVPFKNSYQSFVFDLQLFLWKLFLTLYFKKIILRFLFEYIVKKWVKNLFFLFLLNFRFYVNSKLEFTSYIKISLVI